MNDTPATTPQTVRRVLEELVGTSLPERDIQPVTELANALLSDMAPLRAVPLGDAEPAFLYEASDG